MAGPQTERTFGLITRVLGKDQPDGLPSPALQAARDTLLESSIPGEFTGASISSSSTGYAAQSGDEQDTAT